MRPDNQLWQLTTPMPNGVLQIYRAQPVGNATHIDTESAFILLQQLLLDDARARIISKDGSKLPGIQSKFERSILPRDILYSIISFSIGMNTDNIALSLHFVASHALFNKNPLLFHAKTPTLFPVATQFHPKVLVEAVLHGDETMVSNILKTNPDLTQTATAMDFSGRTFTGTAIQAAIAAADFAPNEASTGLCELLFEALQKQSPERWHTIFKNQTLEFYQQSLRVYVQKTENTIHTLTEKKDNGEAIDDAALTTAKQNYKTYLEALHSDDLQKIIEIHTAAQTEHVLQVDQNLIDAIAIASDEDIQAILNNPEIDSPLSNLLKTFRENFTTLSHQEIIHNPQHLIKIFTLYDQFFNRVAPIGAATTDPECKKRELFWRHLIGFVQRYLPANAAQIFANPSLIDTVVNKIKNERSFDFKYGGNRIFPLSFEANSGLGYKFAATPGRNIVGVTTRVCSGAFRNLCQAKTPSFQNCLRQCDLAITTVRNVVR